MALVPVSMLATLVLFPGAVSQGLIGQKFFSLLPLMGLMTVAAAVFSVALGLPRVKLKAYEQQAILRTVCLAVVVGITGGAMLPLLASGVIPPTSMVIFTMVHTIFTVSAKLGLRNWLMRIYQRGQTRQRVLIYGAGQTGVQLAAALRTDDLVEPVAFVDDNQTLQSMMIAGLPVYSPNRIGELAKEGAIDRVVLAMPSISRPKQIRISRKLNSLGCEVRALPSFASLVAEDHILDRTQPVDPEAYLGRDGLEKDLAGLCELYADRPVMITGAGGSIGSELCRQVLSCRPAKLVLFDVSEFALYQIGRELEELESAKHTKIVRVLGSVTDDRAVRRAVAEHEIKVILHAAAYKHVPLVEDNPLAGLSNNVFGTKILAEAARDGGVENFVFVSTDKAVRPTNVMGASKRLAELVVQDMASRSEGTRFSIVRFGNVLGSSGSVIPLFEEQIARGGPVTLTHSEVTRYFMTIGEAARLVLLAGSFASGGDVFVLDMGQPVQIRELARQMIESAGYSVKDNSNPDGDIEITITGLRPGEKLHEELTSKGRLSGTQHPKIMHAQEDILSQIEVATALKSLRTAIDTNDTEAGRATIRRWVEGFKPYATTEAVIDVPERSL
ncbi:polysaccharide biosynthesis protein [Alphaproteobacteria bacterium KMM 3653]|uniref:Polysaccharide biosynthesis protein n=2 Tax=Harenicola maris TaxID=2841044 RepID=A0AAP2CP36_9RHOB|nr:polysaccharide biosynthesis protein [Harenicola maris]